MTPDKALSLANDVECAIATLQAIADELRTAYPDSDYNRDDDHSEPAAEPPKPATTLEQVQSALAEKSRAGFTAEVKALLKKYGAERLSAVDPKHYDDLLEDAGWIK